MTKAHRQALEWARGFHRREQDQCATRASAHRRNAEGDATEHKKAFDLAQAEIADQMAATHAHAIAAIDAALTVSVEVFRTTEQED